jgi:hypothetical protein
VEILKEAERTAISGITKINSEKREAAHRAGFAAKRCLEAAGEVHLPI